MKIGLNHPHLARWGYWAVSYAAFVGFALVAGWHLKPRWDEIVFAITLPLYVLIPWIIISLIGAWIKTLRPKWLHHWPLRRLFGRLESDQALRDETRTSRDRHAD